MLKNQDIICISSIDWDFIWQGHQEIMSTLARNGNRVLFIENTGARTPGIRDLGRIKKRLKNWFKGVKGIHEEADNLYVFSPIVLPFPYFMAARWVNRHQILSVLDKWIKSVNFTNPVVWIFLPTPLSIDILDALAKKLVVYYCIDSFSASSNAAKKIAKFEARLLKKSDLVFTTSRALYEHCAAINGHVSRFSFGVNFEQFEKARLNSGSIPEDIKHIKGRIIGYVGGVHKWVDQGLIKAVALERPDCDFVFVGPVQTNVSALARLKNVHFLGSKNHDQLPRYIKYFEVCIIPYLISEYTKNVYPTKMNEYLAMGKPVVSVPLPEVVEFNRDFNGVVSIADGKDAFCRCLQMALSENDTGAAQRRIEAAEKNSWKNKIDEMARLIEEGIDRRKRERGSRWKENFVYLYRGSQRRALKFIGACLVLYFVLFKTSFIWFLAAPLKIAQEPQKAGAIVVFGGGVGETGSPGKSTLERAMYAVDLYNAGFAQKIIFSSGYYYTSNDAQNMRLVALSLGVSGKDIILEERANSTYENVIFSKKILDQNKWGSILLVSSPYNMRRASMVFKRHSGVKVFYAPVKKSYFYDREHGPRLEQFMAIMHEYLGIVYYWFKGYI